MPHPKEPAQADPAAVILDRMKAVSGTRTDAELALALGVTKGLPPNWRKRGVPAQYLIAFGERYGVAVEWLRHGVGDLSVEAPPLSGLELALALVDAEQVYLRLHGERPTRASDLAPELAEALWRHKTLRGIMLRRGATREDCDREIRNMVKLPGNWTPGDPW